MRIYDGEFAVQRKSDDSPLTHADLESQRVILEGLRLTPAYRCCPRNPPRRPGAERSGWQDLWVVDPLDGTREFVKRNGEFTINIALVSQHEPVLGIVAAPARDSSIGVQRHRGVPPARRRKPERDSGRAAVGQPLRVVGSRSHASAETAAYLDAWVRTS
jgi:3'(2'), 5'-bisphosphate nucleotidase